MDFTPHTEAERKEMLAAIGVADFKELVKDLPLSQKDLNIPAGLSEGEVVRLGLELGSKNQAPPRLLSFLGAGAYDHFSPAAVSALMSRGEFLTSYTPYQPEVSQGTLQTLYEFQSMICELMAMDVTNAGMYEGASSLAEAVLLALRETGRKKVLIPQSLHPDYKAVLSTYTLESGTQLIEIPYKNGQLDMAFVAKNLTAEVAAVVVQNPNFFGIVEPAEQDRAPGAGGRRACSSPPSTPSRSGFSPLPANTAPISRWRKGSPSGSLRDSAAPYSGFSPAKRSGCARCRDASSARRSTSTASAPSS